MKQNYLRTFCTSSIPELCNRNLQQMVILPGSSMLREGQFPGTMAALSSSWFMGPYVTRASVWVQMPTSTYLCQPPTFCSQRLCLGGQVAAS